MFWYFDDIFYRTVFPEMEDCMGTAFTTASCASTELTDLNALVDDYTSAFCSEGDLLTTISACKFSEILKLTQKYFHHAFDVIL